MLNFRELIGRLFDSRNIFILDDKRIKKTAEYFIFAYMRELYRTRAPKIYSLNLQNNWFHSHNFVYTKTKMQCVCIWSNYYKLPKIAYIQSYTYLFIWCSFSDSLTRTHIYIKILVKHLNFKISTKLPMFWIYFLCLLKYIDF